MKNRARRILLSGVVFALVISLTGCEHESDIQVEYSVKENSPTEDGTLPAGDITNYPAVQYDGETFLEESFSIDQTLVSLKLNSIVYDDDHMSLIYANEIDENRIHEEEVLRNTFGTTGKEVKHLPKLNGERLYGEGLSEEVIVYCDSWMRQYTNEAVDRDVCCTWFDEASGYLHTYEGTYQGIDYYLTISYSKDENNKQILLYPKNITDLTGETGYNAWFPFHSDTEIMNELTIHEVAGDTSKNQTVTNENDLVSKVSYFCENTLCVSVPYGAYKRDNAFSGYDKSQILYYLCDMDGTAEQGEGLIDGYGFEMCWTHDWISSWGEKPDNRGVVYVNDKGIVAARLSLCYELVEEKETTVPAFEQLMKAFEKHFQNEFDTSRVNGNKVSITSMRLLYMPIKSEEGEAGTVFAPVWEMPVWYEKGGVAVVYINAVNGEIERIEYGN